VKGDPSLSFLVNERYTGKLERYMQRASEKGMTNAAIHTFITDGEAVSQDVLDDTHGTAKILDEIQDELGAIDGLIKRMRIIEAEDQPSQ
jgi:glutaredoxin 2